MELGSVEHKELLWKSIRKTALKTFYLGAFIGILMIIPSLIYTNTFSLGLAYAGAAIVIATGLYAGWTAWQKYQKLIKPFAEQFPDKDE
ncbi:hypothetical protein [Thiomicrorhabdus indica]|uniref:hypothetical protein n=1 Tax=Thiomicrorhabdus indica TaxID=2267253 RepID=UPI00102D9B90|nr:hypothetical protein [Thiomicrorhabdus indica]